MATQANPYKQLWEKGNFSKIAEMMRESGDAFVTSLEREGYFKSGSKVLDLGCGDGTTAFPLALRGAHVTGIDLSSSLVAAGNLRKLEVGCELQLHFQEGDACILTGVLDNSFDLLVTVFGAMCAPRPVDVSKEMVRVVRKPGGRIVMCNWISGDSTFMSSLLEICLKYSRPPEGHVSPFLWGVEEKVVERFGHSGVPRSALSFRDEIIHFRHASPPSAVLSIFEKYYGPVMMVFEAAKMAGTEDQLRAELAAMFTAQNVAGDTEGTVFIGRYLRVTVAL